MDKYSNYCQDNPYINKASDGIIEEENLVKSWNVIETKENC